MAEPMDGLIRLRNKQGLTQSDVAAKMGVSQSTVSEMEKPGVDPHLSTLRRYARAVGVSMRHVAMPIGVGYRTRVDEIRDRLGRDLYGSYGQSDIPWMIDIMDSLVEANQDLADENRSWMEIALNRKSELEKLQKEFDVFKNGEEVSDG
jgi:transcriptional regulator with XRE-family HTH domain